MSSPSPTSGPPAQGSSARKISLYNFWLQKPAGIESVEGTSGAPSSSSKKIHTWTHILRLTPCGLQQLGGGLRGTNGVQGEAEMSGIKASRGQCPFSGPSPPQSQQTGAVSKIPSTWITLFDLPWRSPDSAPPKLLFHMNDWSWLLLHKFLNSPKQAAAGLSEP